MTPLGLYEPGTSAVHRMPAGLKFLVVLLLALSTLVVRTIWGLGVLALVVALGYVIARIRLRRCWHTLRLLLPVLLFVFAFQAWLVSVDSANQLVLRLAAAIGAANLFTLTTRIDDVISAVERGAQPLGRFGVRPERVGLLVGLTLQAVTSLSALAVETREAQRARGAGRSVTAFAVPFLVRTLKHAEQLGEALAARGMDDEEERHPRVH